MRQPKYEAMHFIITILGKNNRITSKWCKMMSLFNNAVGF